MTVVALAINYEADIGEILTHKYDYLTTVPSVSMTMTNIALTVKTLSMPWATLGTLLYLLNYFSTKRKHLRIYILVEMQQ